VSELTTAEDVIKFWFEEIEVKQWWVKDARLDRHIAERFGQTHARAARCELHRWRQSSRGRLAEVIVLDQFSRNIYRDRPESFASDPLALALAQVAVAAGADRALDSQQQRCFLYMPYMHCESAEVHRTAVQLFTDLGEESNLDFELRHQSIIERFGRYPHRNEILGRQSSESEVEFLSQPGSSF